MRLTHKYKYHYSQGGLLPECISSSSYDHNAQDVINKMVALGATVDTSREGYINDLVLGLKADGNWPELALLQMFNSPTDASSLFNWTNIYAFFPTKHGTLTFTANKGYTGNGTNGYINSHYHDGLSTLTNNIDDITLFAWNLTNSAHTSALFGANPAVLGASQSLIQPKRADTSKAGADLNSASPANQTTNTIADASGLWAIQRVNSAEFGIYRNGVLIETMTNASVSKTPIVHFVLAQNNDGSAASFSTRQVSLFGAGSGEIDIALLYNRLSTYLTQIGAI